MIKEKYSLTETVNLETAKLYQHEVVIVVMFAS